MHVMVACDGVTNTLILFLPLSGSCICLAYSHDPSAECLRPVSAVQNADFQANMLTLL